MASSTELTQCLLKDKLSRVKNLLNETHERLQEEASQYEIFATKTSATSSTPTPTTATAIITNKQNNGTFTNQQNNNFPNELKRTINDITLLQSVLSCPVFNQIVNVTDSLSKLPHQLNLRPSIGPDDINFDSNGELILKPPIEPASFNNNLNGKLDEYLENFSCSRQFLNQDTPNDNDITSHHINSSNNSILMQQTTSSSQFNVSKDNGLGSQGNQIDLMGQSFDGIQNQSQTTQNYFTKPAPVVYDTERLVKNGTKKHLVNGNKLESSETSSNVASSDVASFEANARSDDDGPRLYKANGNFELNRMVPNNVNMKRDSKTTRSMSQINEQFDEAHSFGYSNEMYKTTHEINRTEDMAIDQPFRAQSNGQGNNKYMYDIQTFNNNNDADIIADNNSNLIKLQTRQCAKQQNRVSPSTSAGSTVRLAEECDSGTSSFRSQAAKGVLYSPQPLKSRDQSDDDMVDNSIDQDFIEKICPEMRRIKVRLEKDDNGLGITIAGYTCDQEGLSGIFIRSITPGSPADKSGKIKILDQIFAVNGQEILKYSNPEATNLLRRHTGRVVTLELVRYTTDSKYRKLQTLLDRAAPSPSLQNSALQSSAGPEGTNYIDIFANQHNKPNVSASHDERDMASSNYGGNYKETSESIYKNTSVFDRGASGLAGLDVGLSLIQSNESHSIANGAQAHIPIAAQRGATTNKIIETKQGARNTIDIRSPLCQTTATATYVNKIADIDRCNSANQSMPVAQFHQDEFGQLVRNEEPEWERAVQIVELCKDPSQGLGFTVKEYANPEDQSQSIIMITNLTPGGIAERDGRLSFGDLLIFVDDTNLKGASLDETVRALKKTSGQVRLGVLKLKRV